MMARGVRRTQSEIIKAQLEKLDEKIAKIEGTLKRLKAERKKAEEELKASELNAIAEFISESGVTVEQLKSIIEKENLGAAE